MKSQFFAGAGVAVLALVGVWGYAYWGGSILADKNEPSISQAVVEDFTGVLRTKVIAEIGQPIEGFEPFMFMRVYAGLTAQDFDNVDALIGRYIYKEGQVQYDLNGEQELHSAARAISDEGMLQLLVNVATRLQIDLTKDGTVAQVLAELSVAPGHDPAGGTVPADGEEVGTRTTLVGIITCLPHKGDGPHTMECAFGLKADHGTYYALQNLWEVAPGLTETNVRVQVEGVLSSPATNEKYDIAGVLDVRAARTL